MGHFVPWDILSLGRFVLGTFCPLDVLSLGYFVLGRFVLGRFVCASKMILGQCKIDEEREKRENNRNLRYKNRNEY